MTEKDLLHTATENIIGKKSITTIDNSSNED